MLDLLFFHRELACLVAIELKVGEFMPEHLGKLEFYLEALDRDVRKPHEHPSIGVLLCANKDNEVVEYALSRSLSPTLTAEYQTRLPDKKATPGQVTRVLRADRVSDASQARISGNCDDQQPNQPRRRRPPSRNMSTNNEAGFRLRKSGHSSVTSPRRVISRPKAR